MTNPFTLVGSVSSTSGTISSNAYLVIVSGANKDDYIISRFNNKQSQVSLNLFNKTINLSTTFNIGKIANLGLAVWTSPIAQNFANKTLPSSILGRLNSSIYDILKDGKISTLEVAESFISNTTNLLDSVAIDLGFPTVSGLYNAIKPNGSGVIAKDFIESLSKFANKNNQQINKSQNIPESLDIIELKLVTEDSEKLSISIPTRKTEKNFNIPVAISNDNVERDFTVEIVTNSQQNMYDIKAQLEKLRDKSEHLDVYVNDLDVNRSELINNCLLSDLNFTINNKNCLTCSLSFTKVPEWEVKIDPTITNRIINNVKNTKSKSSGKANKIKSGTKTGQKNETKKVITSPQQIIGGNVKKTAWNASVKQYQSATQDWVKQNAVDSMYESVNKKVPKKQIEEWMKADIRI